MPPKSLFRQPGAQHFQLVHRSQRDPLIHDPEASQRVLRAFERGNVAKGKSRADLEKFLSPSELAHDKERANIGEAALYGVYFDDTEYDYMKHMRPVGVQEAGVDSVLVEAPVKTKGKGKSKDPIELLDLPPGVLPSTSEIPRNYEAQQNIPSSIVGFQPDLDPHLRQTLEALEDDAFVDDDLDDDFFGELGEETASEEDEVAVGRHALQDSKKLRRRHLRPTHPTSTVFRGGDTVGTLPQFSVVGGKKRRKGSSNASGYSMSSSSMFRNEGLTMLDERFEEVGVTTNPKQYDSDEERRRRKAYFDAMMHEFLDNYEILGGKMRHVLHGDTAAEKLDTIRKAFGGAHVDEKQGRWDCETILSESIRHCSTSRFDLSFLVATYSNLENHPRLIKARQDKLIARIRLDPKTGLPVVDGKQPQSRPPTDSTSESESEDDSRVQRITVSRPKNESKDDKKARKQAVKAERQQRRLDKKATKEEFSSEAKRQNRTLANKEKTKARKL
ncbi:Low temperature viability protein-domain-containing protein [Fomitopsis serialis]|uniref:Low temperature viability protein-domain-containing protein n=1 Tax=Fomitopsis serialis TaxID=139415 RepID=UPI002008730D|nr:Low temperature viability protein-domain-containing protein [Neoantrodia serialis]KAH9929688.1 Low temperature viability protein-domain-containing protein [Neoantrodia serialis]